MQDNFRKSNYYDEKKHFDLIKSTLNQGSIKSNNSKEFHASLEKKDVNSNNTIDQLITKNSKKISLKIENNDQIQLEGLLDIYYFIPNNSKVKLNLSYFSNSAIKETFVVEKNANLQVNSFINGNNFSYVNRSIILNENANVTINTGAIGNFIELINDSYLKGDNSNFNESISFAFNKDQESRFFSKLNHIGQNTQADSHVRGVLNNQAKSSVEGLIKIHPKAEKTNSYLNQHVLMLSSNSQAFTYPSLEIENNDVKASHSASVEQLDEEEIFYLNSRAIDKIQAKSFLIEGYLNPAIKDLDKSLKEKIILSTI